MYAVKYAIAARSGSVQVNCTSQFHSQKLILKIKARDPIHKFSPPIFIPTPHGFSNNPGCVETYTADATATLLENDSTTGEFYEVFTERFSLVALEFGGDFRSMG